MSKYDDIHKTGSTQRITVRPEEDRATAVGNMYRKKTGEDRTCGSEDNDRGQTNTHTPPRGAWSRDPAAARVL